MHLYILISSVYLSFLIYKHFTKKIEYSTLYEELCENFPSDNYFYRINLLRFFSEKNNFEKLDKIFNNNIYKKNDKCSNI